MRKYFVVVKYWAYRHFAMMSAMMILIAAVLNIDSLYTNESSTRLFMVFVQPIPYLVVFFALTSIIFSIMNLIYVMFIRVGREVGVIEYEYIVQLLRDSVLTQQEVSQATHNQMIFYEDYYGLWLLAQKRKAKLKEFNAVKQSLVEQLEDYDKPQEKT